MMIIMLCINTNNIFMDSNLDLKIFIKYMLKILLGIIFIFSIFYDLILSDSNYPILTTIIFVLYILYYILKPYIR